MLLEGRREKLGQLSVAAAFLTQACSSILSGNEGMQLHPYPDLLPGGVERAFLLQCSLHVEEAQKKGLIRPRHCSQLLPLGSLSLGY